MTDNPERIDRQQQPAPPTVPIDVPGGPLRPDPKQGPQIQPPPRPGTLTPGKGSQPF